MTIGISLNPGKKLEALVITDSRGSQGSRQSDAFNKVGEFNSEKYHGVIFGSGNGNIIGGVIKNIDQITVADIDSFVKEIYNNNTKTDEEFRQRYFDIQKKQVLHKAELLSPSLLAEEINKTAKHLPETQREAYSQQQILLAQQKYEQFVEQENKNIMRAYDEFKTNNRTDFVIVAYDKEKKKIRQFFISDSNHEEIYDDHIEIGSGTDGANMYFINNMQGIKNDTELNIEDKVFLITNAYNSSTINSGVGGTPKIVHVTKEENIIIPDYKVTSLVNLSGAYLSKFSEEHLTTKKVRKHIQGILENEENTYKNVAKALELNVDALKTVTIPYSAWQERANHRLFNGTYK